MNTVKYLGLSQTLIALAVLAAFSPARAQDEAVSASSGSVSVGVGAATGDEKDRARFGLYNGLRQDDVNGLLGFEYINRDDATGTWTNAVGRNLGLDNRELFISREKQGDWKLNAGYSEITRHDPRTINTGEINAGQTNPTVARLSAPGTGYDLDLKLRRKAFTLGGEKWFLGNALQFQVDFKTEDKDGARLFGKGFACTSSAAPGCAGPSATATGWALLMLPEPVNSNIKQLDARLNYNTDKLFLSGGYYGSFYNNSNSTLTPSVPGALNNPLGASMPLSAGLQAILNMPMALPPDNQSQQLYLSGNYRFTPTTHGTFKYSYTEGKQDDGFAIAGAPSGRGDLGGKVTMSRYQAGLTARPMPKLSLVADVRYEDKNDKTPIDYYNVEGAATTAFTNSNVSHKRLNGKLEGTYQLPQNYRATLGLDYESMDRGIPVVTTEVAGLTALREKTDETSWRAELRKSMSETLTGAIQYSSARRNGSDYTQVGAGGGGVPFPIVSGDALTAASTTSLVVPMTMTDRTRDKWKLSANWAATDRLSLQFWVEDGIDKYNPPVTKGSATVPGGQEKGLQDSGVRIYSIDAAYAISDAWQLSAYYSYGSQMLHVAHSTGYALALDNTNNSAGIRILGKPNSRFQMGADLSYVDDNSAYNQAMTAGATAANVTFLAANPLPDVNYNLLRLKMFGEYALQKNSAIRLDFIYDHSKLDEWTWGYNGVPFVYNDNTTISAKQTQNVTFLGASYIYKFK